MWLLYKIKKIQKREPHILPVPLLQSLSFCLPQSLYYLTLLPSLLVQTRGAQTVKLAWKTSNLRMKEDFTAHPIISSPSPKAPNDMIGRYYHPLVLYISPLCISLLHFCKALGVKRFSVSRSAENLLLSIFH